MKGGDSPREELGELTLCLGKGDDRHVINGGDEGADEFALCRTMRGGSTGSNVGDARALSGSVRAKMDAKVRRSTVDLEAFIHFMKKWFGSQAKRRDNGLGRVGRNRLSILDMMEMTNVWRNVGESQAVCTMLEYDRGS